MSVAQVAELYLVSDGFDRGMLPIDGMPTFESPFVARASWPTYRPATWALWLEWSRGYADPPAGAVAYDGLTRNTAEAGWPARTLDAHEVVAATVEEDLANLARFRREHPTDAHEVVEALTEHEAALRLTADLARATNGDPQAARQAHLQRPRTRIQGRRTA
jgi:hypothetical protein